jgi:hypothetical protein
MASRYLTLVHDQEISHEQLKAAYDLTAEIQYLVAVADAVAEHRRTEAAIALAAVTALAHAAVQAAVAVVTAPVTAPMFPRLRYSLRDAHTLLSVQESKFNQILKKGTLRSVYDGGNRYVLHDDLMRYLKRDDKTPVMPPKKLVGSKKGAGIVRLLTLPKPQLA